MRLDTDHENAISVPPSSLDAEVFVDPHHPNKLLEGLNRLRLNSVLCDVILCCEGQEVSCHRHVLASFSPYFEAMFTSGMRESTQDRVTISGVEPQMIGLLVNYAYTSKVSISTDNVQALLAASDLLEVTSVREACCEYMKCHLDVNNCVEFYCSADDHSCEMLKEHSLDHILEHFGVIYQKEEFLSLSVERLTEVLSSDHLNVPEEDMVFEAAMLWLDKSPTRKKSFGQVLEHIRLPLVSPSYLHTVVESLDVVKEQQGCQRFISEAKGEQPYSNTARPRRITVIVMLGNTNEVDSFDPLTNQRRTLERLPMYPCVEDFAVCASDLSSAHDVTDNGLTSFLDYNSHNAMVHCSSLWIGGGHCDAFGSSLYLAGGYDDDDGGEDSREMWRYDAHHNSWLRMAPMNEPRYCFSLVMLDGCVFAVGGRGSEKSEDSMEKYHPHTDSWQLMESVGVAEHYNSLCCDVVALDGHLYCFGMMEQIDGSAGSVCRIIRGGELRGQVTKYNPKTSVWTQLAPMQIPRHEQPAACVLNGKIYVTGGRSYNWTFEYTMECFNPQTNQWTMCASMQISRSWTMAQMVVVDGKIYILGEDSHEREDDDDNFIRNIECYCEETDTWTTVGEMPNARFKLECVSLKLRRDHGQPLIPWVP